MFELLVLVIVMVVVVGIKKIYSINFPPLPPPSSSPASSSPASSFPSSFLLPLFPPPDHHLSMLPFHNLYTKYFVSIL
jgi:hypothetical protein